MELKIIHSTVGTLLRRNRHQIHFVAEWTNDRSKLSPVAFSSTSKTELRLPAGNDNASIIHLLVRIRDQLGAIAEFNTRSVVVLPDTEAISNLLDTVQSTSTNNNPLVELLVAGNGNTVGQVIGSVSQVLNEINNQNLDKAVSSKRSLCKNQCENSSVFV